MSESTRMIRQTEEADTEVELSAQELLALSDPQPVAKHEAQPTTQTSRPVQRTSRGTLALSLFVAVGVVGATYVLTGSHGANQSPANTSQQIAQSQWPPPQQLAESDPVRFANPFDTNEVFEFPPGTTEAQARDAVAEVLLKRAMSRQET